MAAVGERIQELDGRFVALALAFQLATLGFRALAWRAVLVAAYPRTRIPVLALGCSYVAGVALNAFVPARGGEAAKVALARAQIKGSSIPTIAASLSVIVLLDAILGGALIGVLWATGLLPSLPLPSVPALAPVGIGAGVALLVVGGLLAFRFGPQFRRLLSSAASGFAVLRSPSVCLRTVLPFHLAAWACRVGVFYFLLESFHIEVGLETAILLAVLNGAATAVPVPGGAGSQQLLATYALQGAISTAAAVSFSLGIQVSVTVVNTMVGLLAAMLLFRTLRPVAAIRAARRR